MKNINSNKFENVTLDHSVNSALLTGETERLYVEHCDCVIQSLLDAAMDFWLIENPEPGDGLDDDHTRHEAWERDQFEARQDHWEWLDWNSVPSFSEYMA